MVCIFGRFMVDMVRAKTREDARRSEGQEQTKRNGRNCVVEKAAFLS